MAEEGNQTTTVSAWDEGFGARLRGKTIHENPFAPFTKSNGDWQEGWLDQDEHLRNRDEALNSIGWFG